MTTKETIFVTGGTGFMGSRVVPKLIEDGHGVICLARTPTSRAAQRIQSLGARLHHGDVTDPSSVRTAMHGCTQVLHMAGLYDFWRRDMSSLNDVNVNGTSIVAAAAADNQTVHHLINISTVAAVGRHSGVITEATPMTGEPLSEYAATKRLGEQQIDRLVNDMLHTTIAPAAELGPGDDKASGQYIEALLGSVLGWPMGMPVAVFADSPITWVHVDDVVDATRAVIKDPTLAGQKYILAAKVLPFREFNALAAKVSGRRLPLMFVPKFLNWTLHLGAWFLTRFANLTGIPPFWGLSEDQIRTMSAGFRADGSKAERELLRKPYRSIESALEAYFNER